MVLEIGLYAIQLLIYNLTVNTGKGNRGAIGIDYLANNRGTVKDVLIRSEDGKGFAGLSLTRGRPGPALVKNVTIEGFDYGVKVAHIEYSITFEHLNLKNQNQVGIFNAKNTLSIRGLHSVNRVPALKSLKANAHVVLIDSQLEGGDEGETAIISQGKMLLRNVEISGYGQAIDDQLGSKNINMSEPSKVISQYATDIVAASNSLQPLDLPIEETPTFHTNDFEQWANVEDYGATADNNSDDDSFGIQAAIDSGAEIVYLPNGEYQVENPIILRGSVKKFLGMESALLPKAEFASDQPLLRFDGGTSDFTIVEHLNLKVNTGSDRTAAVAVEHNSVHTLVVRHSDLGNSAYRNTSQGRGAVFWEDVTGRQIRIMHPQNFWARQLNAEYGDQPLIENYGGDLWILGMKTEGQMTAIKTVNGKTELLGGFFKLLRQPDSQTPLFINDESQVSLSWSEASYTYNIKIKQSQAEDWLILDNEIFKRQVAKPFTRVPLYFSNRDEASVEPTPEN